MALLARVKSKSFLRSSYQGLSEYVVGSSGIQFFTRLYLGEQWTVLLDPEPIKTGYFGS